MTASDLAGEARIPHSWDVPSGSGYYHLSWIRACKSWRARPGGGGRTITAITLLIADDQAPFRQVVRQYLAYTPDITVIGEARDGMEALALVRSVTPQVVLMDVRMPGLGGIAATREITTAIPAVRVIALSQYDDPAIVEAMKQAGAVDYIRKDEMVEKLLPAIRAAVAGGRR